MLQNVFYWEKFVKNHVLLYLLYSNIYDLFSTEEVKTNEIWTDGKPIYRKVIDFGTLPNNNLKSVAHNISNVDKIFIDRAHSFVTVNSEQYGVDFSSRESLTHSWSFRINTSSITCITGMDRTSCSAIIVALYTKSI